jgi:hypothetical protein
MIFINMKSLLIKMYDKLNNNIDRSFFFNLQSYDI